MGGTRQGADILRDLAGLNRRFLRIARGGLPGPNAVSAEALAGLDERARERLASLPFALFSFGFGADGEWERLRSRGVQDTDPPPSGEPGRERFALLALAFVRHVARFDPRRAAAIAGVPEPLGHWLAGLDLGALAALAPRAEGLLRWRFPAQAQLWAALVQCCRDGDGALLPVLRAAGIQWTIRRALDLQGVGGTERRAFRQGPG